MTFSEYPYVRPNIDEIKDQLTKLVDAFKDATTPFSQILIVKQFHDIYDEVDSMSQLCYIRHSLNTSDDFYKAEQEYLDEVGPQIQEFVVNFKQVLLQSKFRKDLEKEFGTLLFKQAELENKVFKPDIIPLLQQENKLNTEYSRLISSAKIEFEGNIYNLSQMRKFTTDLNRDTRKRASLATSKWFESHEAEFDKLYDDMVKIRHEMALKLGYKNFIQLAYDRFQRVDYDAKDVKGYRDQVYQEIVPFVASLVERKKERLGLDELKHYDLGLTFLSGNPTPKGDKVFQVEKARKMYEEMSPETHKFFEFMVQNELMDLDSKPNKDGGGYCTFIPKFDSPFIFANFNGTSGDVDVLTHEAGHAFQVYMSKDLLPEYRWPTMEAAEIHSMSMEFLAWPWIHYFFEEDTPKYKFDHLSGAIEFLPYGVLVDEFQHQVFENPNRTPEERKALWRELEKKYLPFKDYSEDPFLDKGTYWFRQSHIFTAPFYYIDYTLAQVLAFQFWNLSQENYEEAFNKYLELCKLGGSYSFVGLVQKAKLDNPFQSGTIKRTMEPIKAYLNSIDDKKL